MGKAGLNKNNPKKKYTHRITNPENYYLPATKKLYTPAGAMGESYWLLAVTVDPSFSAIERK